MKPTFLQLLNDLKIDLTNARIIASGGLLGSETDFELNPQDFLNFAKLDIKENTQKGYINSLTNSKRAIDCQVDEAFFKCGIDYVDFNFKDTRLIDFFCDNKDLPIKLKIIHSLNLAPSGLISKTRNLRNKLEHNYRKPEIEEVKEAVEIADLFIRSVNGMFKSLCTEFTLGDEKSESFDKEIESEYFTKGISFQFDLDKPKFILYPFNSKDKFDEIKFDINDIEYLGFLRLMFSIDNDVELENSLKGLLNQIGHPIPVEKIKLTQK